MFFLEKKEEAIKDPGLERQGWKYKPEIVPSSLSIEYKPGD